MPVHIPGSGSDGATVSPSTANRCNCRLDLLCCLKHLVAVMLEAHGISTGTAAEMLILVGDNPERIRSEAAFAKLCGVCPIPASSGKTNRHRLNRGGNRQANAALYRVVIVRMRNHQPTLDYVKKRKADGKGKMEIIRCLKRFVAREIFGYLCGAQRSVPSISKAT